MLASTIPNPTGSGTSPSLTDLKAELSSLTNEVTRLVEQRARRTAEMAQAGVDTTRDTIGDFPLASVASAFAVGALLGLVLTTPSRPKLSWAGYDVRSELAGYADELRRGIRSTATGTSMAENLERLSSTLSAVDAKASVGPAIDRILGWFNQAKAAASDAVAKATA